MRDIAAQPFEALSPGASVSGPYLHVSTIGSMEEFGRWYSGLLEPALKLDENLRAMAAQILQRNLSTQGKVQAVYESVQRSTKYVAFEFGVHSYQPYPLATVERRGFGDCKDKAAMIVALLRAVGVPAEFAMVRTRSAGAVDPDAYSVQLFNHAVAYVPELNLYLDGTAEYAAPGRAAARRPGRHGHDRGRRRQSNAAHRAIYSARGQPRHAPGAGAARSRRPGAILVADQVLRIFCRRAAAHQRVRRLGRELSRDPGPVLSLGEDRARRSRGHGAGFARSGIEDRRRRSTRRRARAR